MERENNIGYTEENIRQLLDKYFEGRTTLGEEKSLGDYFMNTPEIPEDLRYAEAMFSLFRERAEESVLPPELNKLTGGTVEGDGSDNIAVVPEHAITGRKSLVRKIITLAVSVAAVTAVIFILRQDDSMSVNKDTAYCYYNGQPVYDKEVADVYVMQIMEYVAHTVEKPVGSLNKLNGLKKAAGKIKYVDKALTTVGTLTADAHNEGDNNH